MNITFGERVALARKRAGLSQEDLADAVNAGRNSVAAWEGGGRLPEGSAMVLLPAALGVSGHWLLTGEGDPYLPTGDEGRRLRIIGRIIAREDDEAAVELANLPGPAPAGLIAALRRLLRPRDPGESSGQRPA